MKSTSRAWTSAPPPTAHGPSSTPVWDMPPWVEVADGSTRVDVYGWPHQEWGTLAWEQMEIGLNNGPGSGGPLLAEALTMQPCSLSAAHCSRLVEAPIQLANKNPFPCTAAGSMLSLWSSGNHSGLTQDSSGLWAAHWCGPGWKEPADIWSESPSHSHPRRPSLSEGL